MVGNPNPSLSHEFLSLGQGQARSPISPPLVFHHLGVVLGASSILGKLDFMGGMNGIGGSMVFMVSKELSCSW